jgi:hypothetical protein
MNSASIRRNKLAPAYSAANEAAHAATALATLLDILSRRQALTLDTKQQTYVRENMQTMRDAMQTLTGELHRYLVTDEVVYAPLEEAA